MDTRGLLDAILDQIDAEAYFTPTSSVSPAQRKVLDQVAARLRAPSFDVDEVRAFVDRAHADGKLDAVLRLSALHVIACHPRVSDWALAARLAGEQELAALDLGGPNLQANLAAVDRHRGVLAYLRGHYEAALEYFTRALERQHSAENLGNVLCALLRLDDEDEAVALYRRVCTSFPAPLVAELQQMVESDADLATLRGAEVASTRTVEG